MSEGYWATVIGVNPAGALVLKKKKSDGVWVFRWKMWNAKTSVDEVRQALVKQNTVYALINYDERTVAGISLSNGVVQEKEKKPEKSNAEIDNKPTVVYIGKKIEDRDDRVSMMYYKEGNTWAYRVRAWVLLPSENGIKNTLMELQDKGFGKKVDAIKSSIIALKVAIAEGVLGHDVEKVFPPEDKYSRQGRDWLFALSKVSMKYLGRDLVDPKSMPAGVRFTRKIKGRGFVLFTNSLGNIAKVIGDVRELDIANQNMSTNPILYEFTIKREKVFVVLGGNQYNLFHLCAVMEELNRERCLGVNGRFLKSVVGRKYRLLAYRPNNGYLVIPYRKKNASTSPFTGVDEGHYILPSVGGRVGALTMVAKEVNSANAEMGNTGMEVDI